MSMSKSCKGDQWEGLWSLEWSPTQNRFHIQSANDAFREVYFNFIGMEKMPPWVTMGVFNSLKEAEEYKDGLVETVNDIKSLKEGQR